MSVLFAFVLRRPVHAMNLDAYYFPHSGVLAVGSGGNHRMLAQVLWGDPVQFGEAIRVLEEDETDPGLAQALLNIESQTACAGIQGTVHLDVDRPEQIALVKELERSVSPDEWHVLAPFLRYSRIDFVNHSEDLGTPEWFATHLESLRSFAGRLRQPIVDRRAAYKRSWWDRLRRVTHKPVVQNESAPIFETWYQDFLSGTLRPDSYEDES